MTELCSQCSAFLSEDEIQFCKGALCFDCCEESFNIDGEGCPSILCRHYNCSARKMDTTQENITDLFNQETENEN